MIRNYIEKTVTLLERNQIIEKEDAEVCAYGLELLLNNIITVLILLLLGFFLGVIEYAVIFTAVFISLKRYTGGFHCNTYGKCLLLTLLVFLLVVVPPMILSKGAQLIVGITFLVYAVIKIYLSTPLANNSRPKTIKQIEESNERKNRMLTFILLIEILLLTLEGYHSIFLVISNSLIAIAMNMGIVGEKLRKQI